MSQNNNVYYEILDKVFADANARNHEYITLEHVLYVLMQRDDIKSFLDKMKINTSAINSEITDYLNTNGNGSISLRTAAMSQLEKQYGQVYDSIYLTNNPNGTKQKLTASMQAYFVHIAVLASARNNHDSIDLLIKLAELTEQHTDTYTHYILARNKVTSLDLKMVAAHGIADPRQNPLYKDIASSAPDKPATSYEEAIELLKKYTTNLNEKAKESRIDPLIGRETEVDMLVQTIARRTKNNVIMVGDSGVGKTAIVEGLAKKIVDGQVPEILKDTIVFSLEISDLVAGTRYRGDLEERVKNIIGALSLVPNKILFIDEIHTIMGSGAGKEGTLDVANMLKPSLARGELTCIGSTTYPEFRSHFQKDAALVRRFKKLEVKEPSVSDAKKILSGLATYYEQHHGVTFTPEAIEAAVDLSVRYINDGKLPDKAIDILDAAGATQRVKATDLKKTTIELVDIEAEVAKIAKIPEKTIKNDESDKLSNLENRLKETVFGQNEAIEEIVNAVCVSSAGLRDLNKPSGSYLFTGPTGTGKTEVSRQLANSLGIPLIKYDMSEFMEKHTVSRLIGTSPGYVGYGDGQTGDGKLINDIETNPHCVLLLDEIEKAHPDVFNILLQVMDDGRLTSSSGKTVSFRNVILIMTSNAGATDLQKEPLGFGRSKNPDADNGAINRLFTPEFRNRLDGIIKFRALEPDHIKNIVNKFLDVVRNQALEKNVVLDVSEEALDWLAKNGYDSLMGARPLSRVIHKHIKVPLSKKMLMGNLNKGGVAKIFVENNELTVQ